MHTLVTCTTSLRSNMEKPSERFSLCMQTKRAWIETLSDSKNYDLNLPSSQHVVSEQGKEYISFLKISDVYSHRPIGMRSRFSRFSKA